MKFRDVYGWPVGLFIGKPVVNFIRLLIHTDIIQTWKLRMYDDGVTTGIEYDVNCGQATDINGER